jgi:hypothetical protein
MFGSLDGFDDDLLSDLAEQEAEFAAAGIDEGNVEEEDYEIFWNSKAGIASPYVEQDEEPMEGVEFGLGDGEYDDGEDDDDW